MRLQWSADGFAGSDWGMLPEDMPIVAELLCRVLMGGEEPERVRADVMDFRGRFQELRHIASWLK